jgi:hypothetical protein
MPFASELDGVRQRATFVPATLDRPPSSTPFFPGT